LKMFWLEPVGPFGSPMKIPFVKLCCGELASVGTAPTAAPPFQTPTSHQPAANVTGEANAGFGVGKAY
jgi:hypothetical protein